MATAWNPPEHDLVRQHTSERSNERIDQDTRAALERASPTDATIQARLAELDREWNVDRALMLNFAIIGGLSGSLAMRSMKRTGRLGGWGAMFFTQIAFLAHHAIRSWCPPMPVFRRLGYRSAAEICAERVALEKQLARE
jgi:hypothetical protein